MRPSQYNYLKRMWTRQLANRGESVLAKIILFPFRLCILVFLSMLYAGSLILFYGTQILFKLIFEFLKLIFSFVKFLFKLFISLCKDFINKNNTK